MTIKENYYKLKKNKTTKKAQTKVKKKEGIKMKKSQEFIDKIYNCRVEELTQQINIKWKQEKQKLKDSSEENSKKLSCYTEESYKQGLLDGMNLMLNALERT